MREFSANFADALMYKMKSNAYNKGMQARESYHKNLREQRKKALANRDLKVVASVASNYTLSQSLKPTNAVSMSDIENCKNKMQLKNLLLKKQKKYEERLDVGGSLNYIEDAYRQIAEEEK